MSDLSVVMNCLSNHGAMQVGWRQDPSLRFMESLDAGKHSSVIPCVLPARLGCLLTLFFTGQIVVLEAVSLLLMSWPMHGQQMQSGFWKQVQYKVMHIQTKPELCFNKFATNLAGIL